MSDEQAEPRVDEFKFKSIGALWKRPEGSKSIATGSIEVDGRTIKVAILRFTRTLKSGKQPPDWSIHAEVPFDLNLGRSARAEEPAQSEPSDSQE